MQTKNFRSLIVATSVVLLMLSMYQGFIRPGAANVTDDIYEENDYFNEAIFMNNGVYYDLMQGDDDWFNCSVPVDYVAKIGIEFFSTNNNMFIDLYSDNYSHIISSNTNEDHEWVSFAAEEPAILYFRVGGQNTQDYYDLFIEIMPKDDGFEPNNMLNESASITFPDDLHDLVYNDEDYFKFYVPSWTGIQVIISFDSPYYAYLYLYDEDYFMLNSSTELTPTSKYLTYQTYNESEYLYLDVSSGMYGFSYNLSLSNFVVPMDDDYEPNNDIYNYHYIYPDYHSGLIQNDDDYYEVYLCTNDNLTIDIFNNGSLWVELYKDSTYITSNSTFNGSAHLDFMVGVDGYFIIRVFGDNSGQSYDMDIWVNKDSAVATEDDEFEDNDNSTYATYVHSGDTYFDRVLADEDWYKIWIEPNQVLKVNISFDSYNTWMYADIYENAAYALSYGWNEGSGGCAEWWSDRTYGLYVYIRITGDYDFNYYDLFILVENVTYDDCMEDNDEFGTAHEIYFPMDEYNLISSDIDYYKFYLMTGDFLEIDLWVSYGVEMHMTLYNPSQSYMQHQQTGAGNNNLYMTYTAAYSGYFYIGINSGYYGDWYDLEMTINGMGSDDWMEENDDRYNPWYVSVPQYEYGLTQADDDYYSLHLNANENVYVEIHCNNYCGTFIEQVNSYNGATIQSDLSNDDGVMRIEFYSSTSQDVLFAVKGNNVGEWYDMYIDYIGANSANPDYNWVSFGRNDQFSWSFDYKFTDDMNNIEKTSGKISATIQDIWLNDASVGVHTTINWENASIIPMNLPYDYSFDVYDNGYVSNTYFLFATFFYGNHFDGWVYQTAAADGTTQGYNFNVYDDGNKIEITNSNSSEFFILIELDANRVIKHIEYTEGQYDQYGNYMGLMELNIFFEGQNTDNTTDDSGDNGDGTLPALPFGEIPGFPIESMFGTIAIAIIAIVRKSRK